VHILHVSDHLPNFHKVWGGAEKACSQIIETLNASGKAINSVLTNPLEVKEKNNFNIFSVPTLSQILKFRIPFDPLVYFKMLKIIENTNPDIVHLHRFTLMSFAVLAAAKKKKIPVIMSIYDYWLFCPKETLIDKKQGNCDKFQGLRCLSCQRTNNLIKFLFMLFRKPVFTRFINQVDAFIVLSSASKGLLVKYGIPEEKIKIVTLFTEFQRKEKEKEQIIPYSILLIGWIQHRKGQHIVLQALPRILKEFPQAKLSFVGKVVDSSYKGSLDKYIVKHNLSGNVEFLGRVSDSELERIFSHAHILAVPEQWQNMSPVIVVEGMSREKVVVASRIGGIPEFIQDGKNGLLANPNTPEEFAQKIIQVFRNKKLSIDVANQARLDIVNICDKEKALEKLVNIYASKI
jgi:glycosyltransferase involved in cell wall biosynthesis